MLAFGLFDVAILEVALALVGSVAVGFDLGDAVESFVVTNCVMGVAFPTSGVLIASHRPRNPIGWLLLAAGIGHATTAAMAPVLELGLEQEWPEPALRTVLTFFTYAWPWSIGLCLPLVLLLFPDGRLLSRRWRWLVRITVVNSALFVAAAGDEPASYPAGITPWLVLANYRDLAPLWTVAEVLNLAVVIAALIGLGMRYRKGDERQRRQLLRATTWARMPRLDIRARRGFVFANRSQATSSGRYICRL